MALDANIELFSRIPHGTGQTYLRELLLVADHNAYHLGQLIALRRALGACRPSATREQAGKGTERGHGRAERTGE